MTTLYEDTNARSLKDLLGEVHGGSAVLPDFQRDFVWDPSAVEELILSIANNFPAGSLLRIRNSRDYFKRRPFEGAAEPAGKPTFLVLDGQQRLTSLYQAFYGRGQHRFFIDVGKLIAGEDLEEALFNCRADRAPARELLPKSAAPQDVEAALGRQVERLIFPLGSLQASIDRFNTWKGEAIKARMASGDAQAGMKLMADLEQVAKRWIAPIDSYAFPVVTLSDDTSAEAVCTIFETLNRTGVKLTPFELLTARFYAGDLNLRELWQASQDQHPILEEFDVDPYAILQAITLRHYRPITIKRGPLMDLKIEVVRDGWAPAVAGLAQGLAFLRDDCGVTVPKWLPYGSIMPVLAATLADRPLNADGPTAGARRAKLRQWFWCVSLGQVYESAAGGKAETDYKELVEWFDGGAAPASVSGFRFDEAQIGQITPRQRALYRSLMCLTLAGQARDFHTHQIMTAQIIRSQQVDDHHIFPLDFLGEKNRRSPDPRFDNILNRTLIDGTTNKRIGANSPAVYLAAIEAQQSVQAIDEVLESHGIDAAGRQAMRSGDFAAFTIARRTRMFDRIKALTGWSPAKPAAAGAE